MRRFVLALALATVTVFSSAAAAYAACVSRVVVRNPDGSYMTCELMAQRSVGGKESCYYECNG
jgi:hypothetical protein